MLPASNETTIYDEKYQNASKKSLDLLWSMKCYIFEAREQYRHLRIMDGTEIQFLHELFDALQSYLNLIGDIVAQVVEKRLNIAYCENFESSQIILEGIS